MHIDISSLTVTPRAMALLIARRLWGLRVERQTK